MAAKSCSRTRGVSSVAGTVLLILFITKPASGEWTVAAYLGAAHSAETHLGLDQAAGNTHLKLGPIRYETRSLSPPLYYGWRATYYFGSTSQWGVEAEMIHLKAFAQTDVPVRASGALNGRSVDGTLIASQVVERFAMSHGLNFALANIVFRTPASRPDRSSRRLVVLVRLGAGPTVPHVEATVDDESHEGYQLGSIGVQAASGVDLEIHRHMAIALEYKLTRTNGHVQIAEGEIRSPITTQHGIIGLAFRF